MPHVHRNDGDGLGQAAGVVKVAGEADSFAIRNPASARIAEGAAEPPARRSPCIDDENAIFPPHRPLTGIGDQAAAPCDPPVEREGHRID